MNTYVSAVFRSFFARCARPGARHRPCGCRNGAAMAWRTGGGPGRPCRRRHPGRARFIGLEGIRLRSAAGTAGPAGRSARVALVPQLLQLSLAPVRPVQTLGGGHEHPIAGLHGVSLERAAGMLGMEARARLQSGPFDGAALHSEQIWQLLPYRPGQLPSVHPYPVPGVGHLQAAAVQAFEHPDGMAAQVPWGELRGSGAAHQVFPPRQVD